MIQSAREFWAAEPSASSSSHLTRNRLLKALTVLSTGPVEKSRGISVQLSEVAGESNERVDVELSLRCRFSIHRQCELKRAAGTEIASGPYAAAMLLDDRPADRQPHAHAIGLRRKEGVEQPADMFRRDSGAGILHRNEYLIGPVLARAYQQFATGPRHPTHGLNAVHQKIHHNLLQLDAVAIDGWERRPQVEP